ncbi:uncharacterized protein LOC143235617 [Tachypleus tridentatus]|uniref:uncharacterized protein LOC143235617 n=1 Tax=Tachypleus tridentatus TaxID=6853 RepID=UPI003FD0CBB3
MNGKRKPSISFSLSLSDCDTDEDLSELDSHLHTHVSGKYKPEQKNEKEFPKILLSLPSPEPLDDPTKEFEYEEVASPGGSSTSSGPVYKRQPGFEYHGHAIQVKHNSKFTGGKTEPRSQFLQSSNSTILEEEPSSETATGNIAGQSSCKKKKASVIKVQDISCLKEQTTVIKPRPKKDPLPMKLRALPQSFWQQPNNTSDISPAFESPILPPLFKQDCQDDVMEIRPVTPPEERLKGSASSTRSEGSRIIRVTNTELLFKLFEGISEKKVQPPVVKRGRPKKTNVCKSFPRNLREGDPCLVSTATESLLPLLPTPEKAGNADGRNTLQPTLTLVSFCDGEKSISLPALNIEQNYSQVLSELVVKL